MVMPLTVFGITIQLGWLCRLTVFGITIQLSGYAAECRRHNHQRGCMIMPLTVFGITIQLEWLCR
jgi:hypothetical protein